MIKPDPIVAEGSPELKIIALSPNYWLMYKRSVLLKGMFTPFSGSTLIGEETYLFVCIHLVTGIYSVEDS